MQKSSQKFVFNYFIIFPLLTLTVIFLANYLVSAWTEPSAAPPQGGVPMSGSQWSDISGGINYDGGVVGIASSAPFGTLGVQGTIRASGDICTDAGGGKCLSTAGSVPYGTIAPFNLASCPSGWVLADGTNGTPDLRGMFVRGLDSGRGIDTGRTLGSTQNDELKSHTHTTGLAGDNNWFMGMSYNQSNGAYSGNSGATGGTETRPKNVALIYCMNVTGTSETINSLWTKNGNDIFYNNGNVGIGDNSPDGVKLDVEGKIGATEYCDQNGANCKTITSMGGSTGPSVYQCPNTRSGCSGGSWASYGCNGQISTVNTCTVIEYPCIVDHSCTYIGKLILAP